MTSITAKPIIFILSKNLRLAALRFSAPLLLLSVGIMKAGTGGVVAGARFH